MKFRRKKSPQQKRAEAEAVRLRLKRAGERIDGVLNEELEPEGGRVAFIAAFTLPPDYVVTQYVTNMAALDAMGLLHAVGQILFGKAKAALGVRSEESDGASEG